jgi:hypothetical protein
MSNGKNSIHFKLHLMLCLNTAIALVNYDEIAARQLAELNILGRNNALMYW